jgi:hypothetical protein
MAQFSWTPQNDVFLPEIDAEHRAIFRAAGSCAALSRREQVPNSWN